MEITFLVRSTLPFVFIDRSGGKKIYIKKVIVAKLESQITINKCNELQ